jgi:hypothetical protein
MNTLQTKDPQKTYIDTIFETACGYELWQTLAKLDITDSNAVARLATYEHTYSGDACTIIEKEVFFFINRSYEGFWGTTP